MVFYVEMLASKSVPNICSKYNMYSHIRDCQREARNEELVD